MAKRRREFKVTLLVPTLGEPSRKLLVEVLVGVLKNARPTSDWQIKEESTRATIGVLRENLKGLHPMAAVFVRRHPKLNPQTLIWAKTGKNGKTQFGVVRNKKTKAPILSKVPWIFDWKNDDWLPF